jgi:hypothetical protein
LTLRGPVTAEKMRVGSIHYASPKPLDDKTIAQRAAELAAAWKARGA